MERGSIVTHFDLVGEFHTLFNYPVRTQLYVDAFLIDNPLIGQRLNFLREERDEFLEAFAKGDLVEMADALCDLAYFAFGTGHCLGVNLNEAKLMLNPPKTFTGLVNPYVYSYSSEYIKKSIRSITKAINEFERRGIEGEVTETIEALCDILNMTYELGYSLNFDMDCMFREVHRSNMTKVCINREDAEESVRRYKEKGTYAEPEVRVKGQYYLVYDKALNKILKNYQWEEPELTQFMGPAFHNKDQQNKIELVNNDLQ